MEASMHLQQFRRSGHMPSLFAALVHFDVSFMVWTILGSLGVYISQDLHLTASQKGLLVATPLLAAAVARVVMGVLADRYGPRRVGSISMLIVLAPLLWGWLGARDLHAMLGVGLLLGVAGGSFAVSLPLASRWFPPKYQGVAMGIAGAGNSGTVVCTLLAPRLAEHVGWHATLGIAVAPVALAFLAFVALAKEPPKPARALTGREIVSVLAERDTWKLCAFYSVTFGCFVGFASFLPILMHDQYGLSKLEAATVTACGAALGSFVRPFGGHLADRVGGTRVLAAVYGLAAVALILVAQIPPLSVAVVAFPVAMMLFGLGNGATFQLVGLRFRDRIGMVTGLVGAAGGLGGFLLPTGLGLLHSAGGYGLGLTAVALVAALAFGGIWFVRPRWKRGWAAVAQARV
jgi:NNP family nitrate/nitrite transporter-like MFS transporter